MIHVITRFGLAYYPLCHRRRLPSGLILVAGIAALLAATPTLAATWTWNGSQGNDHWTNTPNWTPLGGVANNGTADVIFAGSTRLTPDMNNSWNVHSVTFDATAGAFNLGTSTASILTLGAGGITNNASGPQTISHAINLGAAQTWTAGSGPLVINGAINNGGNLLTIDGASSTNLNGVISGSGGLTKNGIGTLTLTGSSNSYTAGTLVEGGTLSVAGTSSPYTALPANGNVTVSAGATLQISNPLIGNNIGTLTLNGGTLRTGGVGGNVRLLTASQLVTGPEGGTVDVSGPLLFSVGVGPGFVINGNTTWTGTAGYILGYTNASPGTPITIAPNVTLTNSVLLATSGNANLYRVAGGGTLYMTTPVSNVPMSFTVTQNSRLRVDDLTVNPSNTSILGAVSAAAVTLDGGTLQYSGPTATGTLPFTVAPGGGTVEVSNPATELTLTGSIVTNGMLNKAGPGVLILNNLANTYPTGIAVSGGRLDVSDDAQLGGANPTVNPAGTLRYTTTLETARTFNLAGGTLEAPIGITLTLNAATVNGGFLRGSGAFELTNGTALNGVTSLSSATLSQTGPVAVTNFSNGGTFTITGGQTLSWNGGANTTTGRLTVTGAANVSDFASSGQLTIQGGGTLSNTGTLLFLGGGSRTTIDPSGTLATEVGASIELNGGLLVNNGTITGTTDVNYGSLAKGTGLYGVVNVGQGGVYAPGNSPGIVTAAAVHFDNTPVSSGAATLQIELAGTTPGTQYDQLHVTGQLSLGGTLQVSLINGFTPAAGNSFDILDWGSLSGTFSTLQLPTMNGRIVWNTSHLYDSGALGGTLFVLNTYYAGDFNRDGHVNAADILPMEQALTNLSSYKATYAPGILDPQLALIDDVNGDGKFTIADLQKLLINLENGGGSADPVPEPSTFVLAVLAFGTMCLRFRFYVANRCAA